MSLFNRFSLRIIRSATNVRNSSSAAETAQLPAESVSSLYTKENNPVYHNESHLNKFYIVPSKDCPVIFSHGFMSQYKIQSKTFAEMALLIRQPAIEILDCLRITDYTRPVNKYVIYGQNGCGKSTLLYHLLHYGYNTNKIIVYVNRAQNWFENPREVRFADRDRNIIDLLFDARKWLNLFKKLNNHVLCQADIKLSKTYEWTSTEKFSEGTPLIDLIEFGMHRAKYSCEIVIGLMNELKQASIAGKCKTLVLIDNYNIFFSNYTQIKNSIKKFALTSEFSLTTAFLEITKTDWCNGEVIVTVDSSVTKSRQDSYFPRYLLSKEGFDYLDPFLPIHVENYTEDEFYAVIDYYKHKKWIRTLSPSGEKELKLLSGYNPYKLMDLCKHL